MEQEDHKGQQGGEITNERLALPNPFNLPSFSYAKWHYMSLFDPEQWYDELKEYTFATTFLPLTKEQATALVHHYQQHQLSNRNALSLEDNDQLEQLEAVLSGAMDQMRRENELSDGGEEAVKMGFFVRLSSRSPKDAGLSEGHPHIVQYLKEEIDKFGGVEAADPNQKTIALQRAAGRILRVTDAKQALWLIVNSERTYGDLVHALGHEDGEWTMKLVVRHWLDGVDLANEYRGFVCEGKLTALSQYNDGNYYPELVDSAELIVSKISEYWKKVKHQVRYQACIVDFVLVNDMRDVYIVEINPFGPVTGAALFDWRVERPLLQGGRDVWGDLQGQPRSQPPQEDDAEDEVVQERSLRYQEYGNHGKEDDEEQRPVLRLVHRAPSYLTEDYLMAFPILELVQRQAQQASTQESNTAKGKPSCSLQ